jgi:hypothetical protein
MTERDDSDQAGSCLRLGRAVEQGLRERKWDRLDRWLERELDDDGVPVRLSIARWAECLALLAQAKCDRPAWPRTTDQKVRFWARALLRFSRTDGTPAGHFDAADGDGRLAAGRLELLLRAYPRSRETRVIAWWLGLLDEVHAPPPLPAWSSGRHPLAVLRASWQKHGDLLVVDQRGKTTTARCELIGGGTSWLGPDWRLVQAAGSTPAPGSVHWVSNSQADCLEWSYRCGGLRATRTALLLRGQQLALLSEQVDREQRAADAYEIRIGLPPSVTSEPVPDRRGLFLHASGSRSLAQVLPIALPALPYETDKGRLAVAGDEHVLSLRLQAKGRRCWLPLLVSWDPLRKRKTVSWRVLTVSEESRVCAPDVAFAVRVSWGRKDTLVIYRSLAAPKRRAFLGHQTGSRLLVGRFTSEGVVEPIFSLD